MSDTLLDKLTEVEKRYQELEELLSRAEVISNAKEYARLGKERSALEEIVACFRERRKTSEDLQENRSLLDDSDPAVRELAQEEQDALQAKYVHLEEKLRLLLIPKDPLDEKWQDMALRIFLPLFHHSKAEEH